MVIIFYFTEFCSLIHHCNCNCNCYCPVFSSTFLFSTYFSLPSFLYLLFYLCNVTRIVFTWHLITSYLWRLCFTVASFSLISLTMSILYFVICNNMRLYNRLLCKSKDRSQYHESYRLVTIFLLSRAKSVFWLSFRFFIHHYIYALHHKNLAHLIINPRTCIVLHFIDIYLCIHLSILVLKLH
jgi:hypothetical protein